MATKAKLFSTFFGIQFIAFMLLVTNLRAIDELQYTAAALTEVSYLFVQWTVLKRVVAEESWIARAGYILGGTTATLTSMWLTKGWS